MPSLCKRLILLAGRDSASVASILAGAISDSEEEEVRQLCRAALETRHPVAVSAVLRALHRLGSDASSLIAGQGDDLDAALDRTIPAVLQDASDAVRLNVIDAIAARARARGARHLVGSLTAPDPAPERAAVAIREIVIAIVGPHGRSAAATADRDHLDRAVAAAAMDYRVHRQRAVLEAGAVMASRPGPRLGAVLAEADHPFTLALRGIAEDVEDPLIGGNLLRWLGREPLARPARRQLHRIDGVAAHTALLADGHLLLAPSRRRSLRQVVRPSQCPPPIETAVALPARAQSHLPELVRRLDLSATRRTRDLADMIALPSSIARTKAVAALAHEPEVRAQPALEPFCFDRDGGVARLATRALLAAPGTPTAPGTSCGPDADRLAALASRGHASVRRRARVRLARTSLERYFEHMADLSDEQRLACALGFIRADRSSFIDACARSLRDGAIAAQTALPVVLLARRLDLAVDLEDALIDVAASPSARLASAALGALARGRSPRRLATLLAGVHHEDDRVRANAVDALRCDRTIEITAAIRPLVDGDRNRSRGSAVRSLLAADPPEGVRELRAMLVDERALHRVTGIWVARRARVGAVRRDLMRLVRAAGPPEVRTRAQAALRLIERGPS